MNQVIISYKQVCRYSGDLLVKANRCTELKLKMNGNLQRPHDGKLYSIPVNNVSGRLVMQLLHSVFRTLKASHRIFSTCRNTRIFDCPKGDDVAHLYEQPLTFPDRQYSALVCRHTKQQRSYNNYADSSLIDCRMADYWPAVALHDIRSSPTSV